MSIVDTVFLGLSSVKERLLLNVLKLGWETLFLYLLKLSSHPDSNILTTKQKRNKTLYLWLSEVFNKPSNHFARQPTTLWFSGATQLVIMLYSLCVHLPLSVHHPPHTYNHTTLLCKSWAPPRHIRDVLIILPLLPLPPPPPPLHPRARWVSGGACRLVPSAQLPLISCPSSSPPPSISAHMAPPQKAVIHAPITIWRFKKYVLPCWRTRPAVPPRQHKGKHKQTSVVLTRTAGGPEDGGCAFCSHLMAAQFYWV